MVQGMCCEDGLHCCPVGSTCDSLSGMCRSSANSFAVSWNMLYRRTTSMGRLAPQLESGPQCPDQTFCDDMQTCCELPSAGRYACCPYAQVCVADDITQVGHGYFKISFSFYSGPRKFLKTRYGFESSGI